MSSLFEDLKEGLQEAIDFEKGTGKAKTTVFMIAPVTKYSNKQIKSIRNKSGMTQAVFANYMGCPKKPLKHGNWGAHTPQAQHAGFWIFSIRARKANCLS